MFTVPGWNLSAKLETQIEKPKPRDPSKEGKKAKKRRQKQEEQVDEGNVAEYWEKVVKGEVAKAPEQNGVGKTGDTPIGDGAQEKKGKKRKRKANQAESGLANGEGDNKDTKEDIAADSRAPKPEISAKKDAEPKRDKKKRKKNQESTSAQESGSTGTREPTKAMLPAALLPPEPKGLTPLQKSMRQKLAGARFRHLNETLYTKPSKESLDLFKEDPSMFEDYHRGFAQQVEGWPENPVDDYVSTVLARGKLRSKDPWKDKKRKEKKGKSKPEEAVDSTPTSAKDGIKPLPRNIKGHSTIADLGCGTASLSYRLQPHLKALNLTINSFDLSKPSGPSAPLVTVADISALPLPDSSVDVAVFCLALMGTNWLDFIDEAYRILRWRGELWISEIKSRFGRVVRNKAGKPPINSIGSLKKADKKNKGKKSESKEEDEGIQDSDDETELAERVDGVEAKEGTDVSAFVAVLRHYGFVLDAPPERPSDAIDLSNKMFVKMQFVKALAPTKGKNVKKEGAGKVGGGGLKMGIKGKKFAAVANVDDEDNGDKDASVLKPCLYKIR